MVLIKSRNRFECISSGHIPCFNNIANKVEVVLSIHVTERSNKVSCLVIRSTIIHLSIALTLCKTEQKKDSLCRLL